MFYALDGTRINLLIYGTGSVARLAWHYFSTDSDYDVQAFVTDDASAPQFFCELPVLDFAQACRAFPQDQYEMFVTEDIFADSRQGPAVFRGNRYRKARDAGYKLASYINSYAHFLKAPPHGDNVFIMEGVSIQPEVRLGSNIMVGSNCTLEMGVMVADHSCLPAATVLRNEGEFALSRRLDGPLSPHGIEMNA